ncbi:toprim domain-containing protein [Deinococcus terrestris]|uniref:toprim domain-containing protein n=1 Tax=Deinococcus terrestris TaxID=2651870 RepID=UPI001883D598|nr:toprim domain-containing protein [Deinococcus terrestris]
MGDFTAAPAKPSTPMPAPHGVTFERGKVDFERIRREHPIEEVASRVLDGYKQKGPTTSVAACPVHGDGASHPNLHIHHGPHPRSGTWICSSCKAHGDVLDLVKAAMGFAETRQALDFLDGGQRLPPERQQELQRRAEENARRAANVPRLNLDLTDFAKEAYARLRKTPQHPASQAPQARHYLAERGLEAAIARYGLGYVGRGFPAELLPQGWDYEKEELYPAFGFFDRVIIPYRQPDGTVPVVNARTLVGKKPKYLKPSAGGAAPGSNARPYRLETVTRQDGVICITEGEFDCMSLGVAAHDLVLEMAIPGVNCFNEKNAEQLAGRDVLLITDNDAAGRRAQGPIRALLEAYAARVTVCPMPEPHKDLNDLLIEQGPAAVKRWIEPVVRRAGRRKLF